MVKSEKSRRKSGPGRRMTSQRLIILDYLKKVRTHPTAEEVYERVSKILPAITLATVYRNLHILAEDGIIRRIVINKEYHFESVEKSHQHLVCPVCGRISDINDEKLDREVSLISKRYHAKEVKVIIYKECERCKNEASKNKQT